MRLRKHQGDPSTTCCLCLGSDSRLYDSFVLLPALYSYHYPLLALICVLYVLYSCQQIAVSPCVLTLSFEITADVYRPNQVSAYCFLITLLASFLHSLREMKLLARLIGE
jgi:hypothetical protein